MFEKLKLKKRIKRCRKEIVLIEKKRIRSQAALVEAILTNKTPDDSDVDFFNRFTSQIDIVRQQMQSYQQELDALNNK